jgi:hypothetical protein
MQVLRPPQSAIARHALSAFSASERAALVMDCSDLFTTSWHRAAVIPESEPQASAFLQSSPARGLPLPPPPPPPLPQWDDGFSYFAPRLGWA